MLFSAILCYLGRKATTNLGSVLKSKHITLLANKGPYSQSYGFSTGHVQMWELDHKEGWVPKNWCFQTVVLDKTLQSSLENKEIKPVHPKGNQPWMFTGRTNAEAEALIIWPPDAKSRLIGKDPDAGKDWGQEEKGTPEDEMVGWHHQFNGHEFEQTLGNSEDTGKLGMLQSNRSQRVGHDLASHVNATKDEDNAAKQLVDSPGLKIYTWLNLQQCVGCFCATHTSLVCYRNTLIPLLELVQPAYGFQVS